MRATACPGVAPVRIGRENIGEPALQRRGPDAQRAGGAEEVLEQRHQQHDGDAVERGSDEGTAQRAQQQAPVGTGESQQPGGFAAHR